MDFLYGNLVALGLCASISESGLRGTFSQVVPKGAQGLLTIYRGNQQFEVQAVVESTRENEARVRFEFKDDQQCAGIINLVKQFGPGRKV